MRMLAGDPSLLIVDVREPVERAEGSIPGSLSYPLGWFSLWSHSLDPAETVVLVCRSGRRSRYAADALAAKGLGRVYNLLGGMQEWAGPQQCEVPRPICGLHLRLMHG
ncbi:MAG: rhodanese-like domain-containing protein [Armatimonadia bacterium]|nr:rhodanese-like domain-containing protein [Armatimonadia bacterium]